MSKQTKYIFITGGVVSSLGKGIAAASLATILESRGLKLSLLKLDPYINVDPGTMNPTQHGEVFVTNDGAETDLDLGHYERFVRTQLGKSNNFTAGRVYENVIKRERKGEYLGQTVQIIPHITDEIKRLIFSGIGDADITLIEIGGTVGDIESLPFLEAIRQLSLELPAEDTLFVHLTLLPFIAAAGELKTKPTQHSVKELRSIGIQPDILICRSERDLPNSERQKIALFTNVPADAVFTSLDVKSIYEIPELLHQQGLDKEVVKKLALNNTVPADLSEWHQVVAALNNLKQNVNIAMVGKYMDLTESYKSLSEALVHASIHSGTQVSIHYIDSEAITPKNVSTCFVGMDAILIPGGFGDRGIEGKITAIQYARESKVPFLGICLGMQLAIIEYARNVGGMADAHSTEFDANTPYPVVCLITEWAENGFKQFRNEASDLGGTMRLGGQKCQLVQATKVSQIYGKKTHIIERHRHRYEANSDLVYLLKDAKVSTPNGKHWTPLQISGTSEDRALIEIIELKDEYHPWFIACQFHPEFTSTPRDGHPLFIDFIEATKQNQDLSTTKK